LPGCPRIASAIRRLVVYLRRDRALADLGLEE
jgi:hypothetical protein